MATASAVGRNLASQPPSAQPADMVMTASQARDLFLQTAIYSSILMDPVSFTASDLGTTKIFKLPQTGIGIKVRVLVTATITSSATITTVTQRAPFNLLSNVTYTDPSGNTRINATPYDLYLREVVTALEGGYDPSLSFPAAPSTPVGMFAADTTAAGLVFNNPVPTTGGNVVSFWFDVPLAMSDNDTRGAILLESATSPSFMQITLPASIIGTSGVEVPYVHASATLTSITSATIQPVYYFYRPTYVTIGGKQVLPIPVEDLNVIHEVISVRNSSSLNTNSDNRIFTLPTGRSYYGLWAQYVNNGAFKGSATADVSAVKMQYDQSTFTLQENLQGYLSRVRRVNKRDLPLGVFYWDWRQRPWDSSHYGQLDPILTLGSTSLTSPYVQVCRDALYTAPMA